MSKVTVTIEGNADDVINMIRQLAGEIGLSDDPTKQESRMLQPAEHTVDQESDVPAEESNDIVKSEPVVIEPIEPSAWNAASATMFWQLLADNARQILVRVSRSPQHSQKRAQIMHTMQRSGQAFAGTLSSVGHNVRKVETKMNLHNLPRPLILDKERDSYVVDASFAKIMEEIGVN